jgi:hypothetical protein
MIGMCRAAHGARPDAGAGWLCLESGWWRARAGRLGTDGGHHDSDGHAEQLGVVRQTKSVVSCNEGALLRYLWRVYVCRQSMRARILECANKSRGVGTNAPLPAYLASAVVAAVYISARLQITRTCTKVGTSAWKSLVRARV